jgi:hypothetical protein
MRCDSDPTKKARPCPGQAVRVAYLSAVRAAEESPRRDLDGGPPVQVLTTWSDGSSSLSPAQRPRNSSTGRARPAWNPPPGRDWTCAASGYIVAPPRHPRRRRATHLPCLRGDPAGHLERHRLGASPHRLLLRQPAPPRQPARQRRAHGPGHPRVRPVGGAIRWRPPRPSRLPPRPVRYHPHRRRAGRWARRWAIRLASAVGQVLPAPPTTPAR